MTETIITRPDVLVWTEETLRGEDLPALLAAHPDRYRGVRLHHSGGSILITADGRVSIDDLSRVRYLDLTVTRQVALTADVRIPHAVAVYLDTAGAYLRTEDWTDASVRDIVNAEGTHTVRAIYALEGSDLRLIYTDTGRY